MVKANGSVAWIGRMFGGSDQENLAVQKVDENGKAVLDRGPEIGPRSLAKARDELTIYWTEGGVPATAPLS